MDIWMFRVHKTRRRLILLWLAFLSPTPYGSLTSHVIRDLLYFRVLNSFVLLIHNGASWCSFAESCSDGDKSDLALYVCFKIVPFLSAPCGGRLLNLTVLLLTLPVAACGCQKASSAHHRSLHLPGLHKRLVSAYSWSQSRIVSSWADCSLLSCNTCAMT